MQGWSRRLYYSYFCFTEAQDIVAQDRVFGCGNNHSKPVHSSLAQVGLFIYISASLVELFDSPPECAQH